MASSLPWIWTVEALASNQADASLLTDLVKNIPEDILKNDWKNVKEMTSLRMLESLSVLGKRKASNVGFNPSDSCEDVLKQILFKSSRRNDKSTNSDFLSRDVERYVQDKRSSLPKCRLEQFKALILEDSPLLPLYLKEKSGLLMKNDLDNITNKPEGGDCDSHENSLVRDLSSAERVVDDSAIANQERVSAGKQVNDDSNPNLNAAKRRKHDAFCTHQVVEGNDPASLSENRHTEDVPGVIVLDSGGDVSELHEMSRMKSVDVDPSEKNDHGSVATKKLKMSSTADDAGFLHDQIQATCDVGKMTQGTSGEEQGLNISNDEPRKNGECSVELRTSGSLPQVLTQEAKLVDAAKDNCDPFASNSECCGKVKATMEHDHYLENISDDDTFLDENDDIILRKDTFLNSQFLESQDSLATVNGRKQQLCMICNIGGQLLVCNSESCQRVIHERCMGVAPTFDTTRSFYCPFCSYSRAISEYVDSKKKASLAKKDLVTFFSRVEHRVGRENESQFGLDLKDNLSVSCDSASMEGGKVASSGGNKADKENEEISGSRMCQQTPIEQEQQSPVPSAQNLKADNSLHVGIKQLSAVEKLPEVVHQPKCLTLVKKKRQKETSGAIQESKVHSPDCPDSKIAHGSVQNDGNKTEQNVSNQIHLSPRQHAKPSHSGVEGNSGENDDKFNNYGNKRELNVSNEIHLLPRKPAKPSQSRGEGSSGEKDDKSHYLRVQKQKQQYSYPPIPLLGRRKTRWTKAEEETLKEGVEKFTSNLDLLKGMPWKQILEFGAGKFQKHRTAVDLKDKWRNICKKSQQV